MNEIDFVAEHPKKDMSKVNRIRVNGKVYLAADKVLEIIDWNISQTGNERESISKSARLSNMRWLREKVEELKGGEQE